MKRIISFVLLIATAALACLGVIASREIFVSEYRLGLGLVDNNGKGQIAAAVVIDSSDRIVAVRIDEVDISKGVTDSKKAQGDAYGMLSAWGSSLAEWDDQVAHLELQLIGRNLEQIKATNAKDADISAGCTIYIGNFTEAVARAINDAETAEVFKTGNKLSLDLAFNVVSGETDYASTVKATVSAKDSTLAEDSGAATFVKPAPAE